RIGYARRTVSGLTFDQPTSWNRAEIIDPRGSWPPELAVDVRARADEAAIAYVVRDELGKFPEIADIADAPPSVTAPGWTGHALRYAVHPEGGGRIEVRTEVYTRPLGAKLALLVVVTPDAQAAWVAPVVEHVLESVR